MKNKKFTILSCLFLLSASLFIIPTYIVSGDQSFYQNSKAIDLASDNQRKIGITNSEGSSRKRYIGIWTEDYMQYGQSQGAIIANIAKNAPVQGLLRLNDVIFAINEKKVLSSQDVIDAIPLIPSSRDRVEFDILRNEEVLTASCSCIYIPPVNLEPFYQAIAPCSLRTVEDSSGDKIVVAPVAYIVHLCNIGGIEAFERQAKDASQKDPIGAYHTLHREKWFGNGVHDFAIPAVFLRSELQSEIMNLFLEAFAHFNTTNGKKSCYLIHHNSNAGRQNLSLSIEPIEIEVDTFIGNYKFIREWKW